MGWVSNKKLKMEIISKKYKRHFTKKLKSPIFKYFLCKYEHWFFVDYKFLATCKKLGKYNMYIKKSWERDRWLYRQKHTFHETTALHEDPVKTSRDNHCYGRSCFDPNPGTIAYNIPIF